MNARLAVIGNADHYEELKSLLSGTGIEAAAGSRRRRRGGSRAGRLRRRRDCRRGGHCADVCRRPLWAARRSRRTRNASSQPARCSWTPLELAGTELVPVDSEHSAAFQVLAGAAPESVETIVLTASGGPFRTWDIERISRATPEEAVRHPNWSMGAKISVDSATMMNKGLELIEAYHLFPVEVSQLGVIVHPQSIIHCLVGYTDGSVIAQLSFPDMRTPIALALSWPARMVTPTERLDLLKLGTLSFEAPDETRFPALRVAREALRTGGSAPAVLNAANEVAVEAFLKRRIGFAANRRHGRRMRRSRARARADAALREPERHINRRCRGPRARAFAAWLARIASPLQQVLSLDNAAASGTIGRN